MEGHWFKFKDREIFLTESEMTQVHEYYEIQRTAEYLRENHKDWSEEKVQEIATETRRQMDKYDFSEEYAIKEAIRDLGYEEED